NTEATGCRAASLLHQACRSKTQRGERCSSRHGGTARESFSKRYKKGSADEWNDDPRRPPEWQGSTAAAGKWHAHRTVARTGRIFHRARYGTSLANRSRTSV